MLHIATGMEATRYGGMPNLNAKSISGASFGNRHNCLPLIPMSDARHCAASSTQAEQFLHAEAKLFGQAAPCPFAASRRRGCLAGASSLITQTRRGGLRVRRLKSRIDMGSRAT